ncbi:MAG: pyridoxamine 5'-phosphate oxidase family protein, partial [Lachnospiraceae bacterium]|nr:pyridoxamine 5'-phosphate oxidase family protein [Lachnospiraceae bacterium]
MRRKDREINDIKTITSILDMCKTASIAMIDSDAPYVVPLSYGYEMKENILILYFHCAKEGRKIDILKCND